MAERGRKTWVWGVHRPPAQGGAGQTAACFNALRSQAAVSLRRKKWRKPHNR